MIQCVKQYVREFAEQKKRLVLVMPPEFTLPTELTDDVVMLDFFVPSYAEMRQIYDNLMAPIAEKDQRKVPDFDDDELDTIVATGMGLTAGEFETACARALVECKADLPGVAVEKFREIVQRVKVDAVRKSEVLEVMNAEDMNNVGGLENLKEWITERRICFSPEAAAFGVDPLKGLIMVGPPGTGKSITAKAIASLFGIPLIRFDVGKVFNSLVGSSEARIRGALQMVDAMAPCVLLLDEVDKAGK